MIKKTAYILVGLPASGKSTYIKNQGFFGDDAFIYSTDDAIQKKAKKAGKTYDDVFTNEIDNATKKANKGLQKALEYGRPNIICDQTNLGKKKRSRLIARFKQYKYRVVCVYFPIYYRDNSEWIDRLYSREGKTIPNEVVLKMIDGMNVPDIGEGFHEIRYIHTFGSDYCEETDREVGVF